MLNVGSLQCHSGNHSHFIASIPVSLQEPVSGHISSGFVILACISWGLDNHLSAIINGVSVRTIPFIKVIIGGKTDLTIGLILTNGKIQMNYILPAILVGIFSYWISPVLYVYAAQNIVKASLNRIRVLYSIHHKLIGHADKHTRDESLEKSALEV